MTILISIAATILVVLSAIAAHYLVKLRKVKTAEQKQIKQNQEAWLKHKNELVKDIQFIANSMLQEQCEITEGCLRIGYLIPRVVESDDIKSTIKHIFEHHSLTANMPIKEAYKALSRKEQFKLDSQRLTLEAKNKNGVLEDCKTLLNYSF